MQNNEPRVIYVTATTGATLSICGYCRKVTGNVTAIISTPFYELDGTSYFIATGYPSKPEMLNVRFKPAEHCTCVEDALRGVTVEQS